MQMSIFDGSEPLKITKPIRMIELFAGIGAQSKALENLGANFEHYRICEFDKYAVRSYNAVHGTNFETSDITKITADDLGITDTDKYTYIMTYSFPCTDLSLAGKQAGMEKGSGTRSGLLWEVERLLRELSNRGGAEHHLTATRGILLSRQATKIERETEVASACMARDYKGFGNQAQTGVIEWKK